MGIATTGCILTWGRGNVGVSLGEQRNARGHADESEDGSVGENNRISEEELDEDGSVGGDDTLSEGDLENESMGSKDTVPCSRKGRK